ncbi:unnamed protein product, partial [Staurois parvus]
PHYSRYTATGRHLCAESHININVLGRTRALATPAIHGRGCQSLWSQPVITRRCPVITEHLRRGGRLFCLQTIFFPVSSSTLLGMVVYSTAILISVLTVKNTPHHLVKHSQHTVNPLIAPHINPFLP